MPLSRSRLVPLVGPALLVAAWAVALRIFRVPLLPDPWTVARAIGELAASGLLLRHVVASLYRVTWGYLLAVVLAVPAGLWLGTRRRGDLAFGPFLEMLRPISPLAWIPVAIVLFGISNAATVFLVFLAAFFPIVVATMNGVRSVPPMYLRAGRNFGLSTPALLWRVALPGALPQILVGLRIALGVAWLVVVAAEMIAVDSGLGYLVIDARNAGKRYDLVVAAILLIGAIGLALDLAARRIERLRSVRWGFRRD